MIVQIVDHILAFLWPLRNVMYEVTKDISTLLYNKN